MSINTYEKRWIPMNSGRNGMKRRRRAVIDKYIAANRNKFLSGWKREVRRGRL